MIGCCRGDPVNVDLELATQKGIPVFHTPGRNADAVADLTLAFMLDAGAPPAGDDRPPTAAARRRASSRPSDFLKLYTRFTGVELGGLTVGLVGLGAVGREVAARLAGFKAARPRLRSLRDRRRPPASTLADLDTLLREADIVSLHAPVTPETHGLLSARAPGAHEADGVPRQHGARGAHRRERALRGAASRDARRRGARRAGRGAAAARQPVPRAAERHRARRTSAAPRPTSTRHQSDIVVDAMERWLRGERPRWIANPAVLDGRALSAACDCLLTLDAGTGSGRCVVFDLAGTTASRRRRSRSRITSSPIPTCRWCAASTSIRSPSGTRSRAARGRPSAALPAGRAHPRRRSPPRSARAACSSTPPASVLYAGPNLDARAVHARAWRSQTRMAPRAPARDHRTRAAVHLRRVARCLWFRQHHDASRVATVLMLNDWITYLLSGARVAEHSNASESMLYDVTRRRVVERDPGHASTSRARSCRRCCDAGSAGRARDRRARRRRPASPRARRCSPAAPTPRARCSAAACTTSGADRRRPRHDHAGAAGRRHAPVLDPDGNLWTSPPRRARPLGAREQRAATPAARTAGCSSSCAAAPTTARTPPAEAAMADGRPGAARRSSRHLGPARLQPAEHESVPAGGPALPLPAAAHRPSDARRSAARVPRERRLRDPRQLRADRGGLAASPAERLWVSGGHDREPHAAAARRDDARRAADGRRGAGEREPRLRDPRRRSARACIPTCPTAVAAMVRTRTVEPDVARRRGVQRALPALARDVRVLAELDDLSGTRACARSGACCFDLDGTLVDTERVQWQAYRRGPRRLRGRRRTSRSTGGTSSRSTGGAEWACRRYGAADRRRTTLRAPQGRGVPRADRGGRAADARARARASSGLHGALAAGGGDELDARRDGR